RNRVETVTTDAGVAAYEYWEDGLLKRITYPNGSIADYSFGDSYDQANRLTHLANRQAPTAGSPGFIISSYQYAYDANGNRLTQVETQHDINGGAAEITAYVYDILNRLHIVTYGLNGAGGQMSYTYAANGNRLAEQ